MIVFGPGSAGAIVLVRCPSCGEVQARPRTPKGTTIECRKCGKPFVADEHRVPFMAKR